MFGERPQFAEPSHCQFNRWYEVAALKWLHEIRKGACIASFFDQVSLTESSEQHDGAQLIGSDLSRGGEPIDTRHLDVENGDFGLEVTNEGDGFVAPSSFTDDLVSLFFEGLFQIESDDRLVFGDDDTGRQRCSPLRVEARPSTDRAPMVPVQPMASLSLSSKSSCCCSSRPISATTSLR